MFGFFGGDKKTDNKKKETEAPKPTTNSVQKMPVSSTSPPVSSPASSIPDNESTTGEQRVFEASPEEPQNAVPGEPTPRNRLMVSKQRHRAFYERASRELLASGHEEIQLSALGNAVPLAVEVALSLQGKKAASVTKIATKQVDFPASGNQRRSNAPPLHSSGITILLKRDPEFKGTRIVPGHVFFCPKPEATTTESLPYPQSPDLVLVSVNAGTPDALFTSSYGKSITTVLEAAGQNVGAHKNLHQHLFSEAVKANEGVQDIRAIKFIGELSGVKTYSPDLKAAFVRVPPTATASDLTGTTFIHVFEDEKFPHGNDNNAALVHIIAPRGDSYPTPETFLSAVQLAATTLMNALCDFNGYARRHSGTPRLRKLVVARMGLFSSEPGMIHPKTTKDDLAKAILKGLDNGYHFGTSPRLQFLYDPDDTMKKAWLEASGAEDTSLQTTDDTFRRRSSLEYIAR